MTRDRGSASLELVLMTPALVMLLLLVVLVGRVAQARADVDAAARDAARAASLSRSPAAAVSDGRDAAAATLEAGGVTCRSLDVSLDASNFAPAGEVAATVTCTVDLSDLSLLGVPGARTITATFEHPVDTYRGASL